MINKPVQVITAVRSSQSGPGGSAPGGSGLGGERVSGGLESGLGVSQNALRQTPPPVNRTTDTCKNITLPQLRFGR